MKALWTMISCLQMILFLPLMNVNMPNLTANVFTALQVSAFTFFPFSSWFAAVGVVDDSPAYTVNFNNQGYGSSMVMQNCPDIVLMFLVTGVLLAIFQGLARLIEIKSPRVEKIPEV